MLDTLKKIWNYINESDETEKEKTAEASDEDYYQGFESLFKLILFEMLIRMNQRR
jgi:hypothetical protein